MPLVEVPAGRVASAWAVLSWRDLACLSAIRRVWRVLREGCGAASARVVWTGPEPPAALAEEIDRLAAAEGIDVAGAVPWDPGRCGRRGRVGR